MRLQKIGLLLSIFSIAFHICFAQESPKALLIMESGRMNCEEILAATDVLYVELNNLPTSHGYFVIYGKDEEIRKKADYEMLFDGAIYSRNFDVSRINKVRGEETENIKVQFWLVPAGAEKPDFKEAKWDFTLPPETKPYIFYSNSPLFDGICERPSHNKTYSEFIIGNPTFRGNIVIYESSLKKFRRTKAEILKMLPDIPKNRLKFFYVQGKDSIYELWIVPPKIQ